MIALLVPPVLTATMYLAFTGLVAALGFELGYLAAFAIYWVGWCPLVPVALLGPQKLVGLFEDGSTRFASVPDARAAPVVATRRVRLRLPADR